MKEKERDIAIDIAKAFGILFMIIGHFKETPWLLRHFIFSFHMPLFFIFSGYFYKSRNIKDVVRNGNKSLVKPYLITSLVCVILWMTVHQNDQAFKKIIGAIMANGTMDDVLIGAGLPNMGPVWFLMALYWCKIFYAMLKQWTDKCLLASFIISTVAFIIGRYAMNLPFGILVGMCGLVFYAMGDYWRNRNLIPQNKWQLGVGCIIWIFCIYKSWLNINSFCCTHYPITMVGAFIGTYMIYLASKRTPRMLRPFMSWVGRNTMLILCYYTLKNCILSNVIYYVLQPLGLSFPSGGIGEMCIVFALSLGLPFIHGYISHRCPPGRL